MCLARERHPEIKYVKDVYCVDHLRFVQNVTNVPIVAIDLPVGGQIAPILGKWVALGTSPEVITVLKELAGRVGPLRNRPLKSRPWANRPPKNSALDKSAPLENF